VLGLTHLDVVEERWELHRPAAHPAAILLKKGESLFVKKVTLEVLADGEAEPALPQVRGLGIKLATIF
jgi:hypothetical protein